MDTPLLTTVTIGQIVREYFPTADKDFIEHILWSKTPYPMVTIDSLRTHLQTYARALKANKEMCYCCGKFRKKSDMVGEFCKWGDAKMRNRPVG